MGKEKMKVWLIRGEQDTVALGEFYKEYPQYINDKIKDEKYLYWTRKSKFSNKEVASIQTNKPSAERSFKRAKKDADSSKRKIVKNVELIELELKLPLE